MEIRNFSTSTSGLSVALTAVICGWISTVPQIPASPLAAFFLSMIAGAVFYSKPKEFYKNSFIVFIVFTAFFLAGIGLGLEFKKLISSNLFSITSASAIGFLIMSSIVGILKDAIEESSLSSK